MRCFIVAFDSLILIYYFRFYFHFNIIASLKSFRLFCFAFLYFLIPFLFLLLENVFVLVNNSCFIAYIIKIARVPFGSMLATIEKSKKKKKNNNAEMRYVHDISYMAKDKRHIVISINYFDFETNSQNANASKCHLQYLCWVAGDNLLCAVFRA